MSRAAGLADERGSGTMLMVGVLGVLLALATATIWAAGYLAAAHKARAAADLAALSGAVAIQAGADGCAAARRVAVDNGTELSACDRVGDQVDFVISVEVARPVRTGIPGLPAQVTAVAHAAPHQCTGEPGSAACAHP
jgi:secretion/DNA translocation related TadE-like protein